MKRWLRCMDRRAIAAAASLVLAGCATDTTLDGTSTTHFSESVAAQTAVGVAEAALEVALSAALGIEDNNEAPRRCFNDVDCLAENVREKRGRRNLARIEIGAEPGSQDAMTTSEFGRAFEAWWEQPASSVLQQDKPRQLSIMFVRPELDAGIAPHGDSTGVSQ